MANFVFNAAKGRAVQFYANVDANSPSGAELVVILLASTGLELQGPLEDAATFAEVIDGTTNEATNTGYARKVLVAADLSTVDDGTSDNIVNLDIPDQTWTGVANDGTGGIGALVIGYDASGAGTNSGIIPISHHDFAVTPDGSDITAVINASGFFTAT